jgi:predicted secreted protein
MYLFSAASWAQAATTLDLSVTGKATCSADALDAQLTARTSAASAAKAQAGLNQLVASALRKTHAVKGVTAITSGYDVAPVYPKQTMWEARQNLRLTLRAAPESQAAQPMLALLGQLQQNGLMLESLQGRLTAAARQQAEQAAIQDAVKRLKAQAAAVAKALGDQPGEITHLRLNLAAPLFRPMIRAPMAMGAAAMQAAPPSINSAPVTEQATLSGTVRFTRRNP